MRCARRDSSPTATRASAARARASSASTPRMARPSSTFSDALRNGSKPDCWPTMPTCAALNDARAAPDCVFYYYNPKQFPEGFFSEDSTRATGSGSMFDSTRSASLWMSRSPSTAAAKSATGDRMSAFQTAVTQSCTSPPSRTPTTSGRGRTSCGSLRSQATRPPTPASYTTRCRLSSMSLTVLRLGLLRGQATGGRRAGAPRHLVCRRPPLGGRGPKRGPGTTMQDRAP